MKLVTKMNYHSIVLDGGEIIDRKLSAKNFHTFEEMIPGFYLIVDGKKITEKYLKEQKIF